MIDANLGIIILCGAVALIIGGGLGFFIGRGAGKEKQRINELETQLEQAMKDMEVYRVQVNAHFKKTSELFRHMTDSYKAVYVHLANGSQSLCTAESAMLSPADSDFLTLTHDAEKKPHEQEKSAAAAEESLSAEEELGQLDHAPGEEKEQQLERHEEDLHLETVKEPDDLFHLEAKDSPQQEKGDLNEEQEDFWAESEPQETVADKEKEKIA